MKMHFEIPPLKGKESTKLIEWDDRRTLHEYRFVISIQI